MKNVLIITEQAQSYYYHDFLRACSRMLLAIYIFDVSLFPAQSSLTIYMGKEGEITGEIDVLRYEADEYLPATLSLSSIDVAWYLRPGKPKPIDAMSPLEAEFSISESYAAIDSLCSLLKCNWINKRETISSIENNKLLQQRIAAQCGLSIPLTLVTNKPKTLGEYFGNRSELLLKTIGYMNLSESNSAHYIYSQLISSDELREQSVAIQHCPVFAQTYIDKKYEYRVMAIGAKVLACRIDSQASDATKIDWRHYDFDRVEHVEKDLPADTKKKLLHFMKTIGLRYGAIDLIETHDGDFVFLEVNPSGQWDWIRTLAGLKIPEAVSEMLLEV